MSWGQMLSIGGMQMQDIASFIGASRIAKRQREGNTNAENQINAGYSEANKYQQPYYEQGTRAYKTLGDMIDSGAFDMQGRTFNEPTEQQYGTYQQTEQQPGAYNDPGFNFEKDPGYNFRLQQGMNRIGAGASGSGSMFSGATLKALQKYGQDYASDEFGKAYGRYQDKRNFDYNNYLGKLGQYNTNRNFNYNSFANDRNFGRDQFVNNRNFAYNNFTDQYNRDNSEMGNRYNRRAAMANTGINAGNNLSNNAIGRGGSLADLAIQRGNINAGEWLGYTNAAINMGKHLQQIGSMNLGDTSQTYQNATGRQGGGMQVQQQGGGMGGMNMGGMMGQFMGGQGGSSGGGMSGVDINTSGMDSAGSYA